MDKDRHDELASLLNERELRSLQAEQASRDMASFVSFTKDDYVHNAFSREVCAALDVFLEDVRSGRRPLLVIQAPPQHGKSELVSRRFPAYALGRYPNLRIGAASYGADLARDMSLDVQRIMLDELFRAVFPGSALSFSRNERRSADRFDVPNHRGYYVCTGVGGPLTGKSMDIGIIDDPIKNQEEARSDTIKNAILNWYNTVFLTRLSKLSGQIIMATSWAVDDLAATIVKKNPKARHLKFPAISPEGHALVPELHPLDKLLETKAAMTPAQWSALYMQSAVREGGNIFQEDWIKRWTKSTLPSYFDEIIQSWDMTFKDTDGSDYVVGQVWGRSGARHYLLYQVRDRLGFTASVQAVKTVAARFPQSMAVLIEDKANGPAVMDTLKDDIPGLVPIEPDGSKVARAHAVTALWSGGNVFIPEDDEFPWVPDFVSELISFPASGYDDQVDSMTQALRYLKSHGLGVWEALADG
ncbi:MAG: phage terminase large subunit [Pseudodesulfovibrio sp.]|uniref:phage terminase large subunit n=1 Tax=Pseudodesulfovibrio sp. TaxID=2035812 RepID=UPI003D12F1E7